MSGQLSGLQMQNGNDVGSLSARLAEVEKERDTLRGWQKRAQALSIELEEQKRRADEGRRAGAERKEDDKTDEVVRKELRRG